MTLAMKKTSFDACAWLIKVRAKGYEVYLTEDGVGLAHPRNRGAATSVIVEWRKNKRVIESVLRAQQS
jgi:hypothetical protein